MIEYVCGFLIHRPLNLVALVRKKKPLWQAGLLNGIGGKVEALCACHHVESMHGGEEICIECNNLQNLKVAQCKGFNSVGTELPYVAMTREFKEETGVYISTWNNFLTLNGEQRRMGSTEPYTVHFLRAFAQTLQLMNQLKSTTEEQIVVESISNVNTINSLPNLSWIIRMALDIDNDVATHFEIKECYESN